MNSNTQKIVEALNESKVKESKIKITCKIRDIEFEVLNKDIMGGLIQSWLEVFLTKNEINWKPRGSQQYPDFVLDNDEYLEIKCYFKDATPAFDIANFKSLINDLTINPKRLDSDYLIFNYGFDDNGITLNDYWCKKIWEITSIPTKHKKSLSYNLITAQVKQGTIYNLRPFNFTLHPEDCLSSRLSFVEQLKKTIDAFSSQLINQDTIYESSDEWFALVSSKYEEQTKREL